MSRAKALKLHKGQALVWRSNARFKVIVAGRRWGKTQFGRTDMIRAAAKPNRLVWYVAPTYAMAKTIMWPELLDAIPRAWIKKTNETGLYILLKNKTMIVLKGADKYDSLRGVGLDYVVLDEFQDMHPDTWKKALRPTLATTGGKATFIGTPKSFNYLHDVYQFGQNPKLIKARRWESWQFKSIDSPFVPASEIEQARQDMDERSFKQEFEACHLPSTLIQMADGSEKKIQDITVGDKVLYLSDDGKVNACTVEDGGPTGSKSITHATLETGEIVSASDKHRFKIGGEEYRLNDASELERVFQQNLPQSKEAALAAVLAYNMGDGTITQRKEGYYAGGMFANNRDDLERLARVMSVAFEYDKPTVRLKKGNGIKSGYGCAPDTYQVGFSDRISRELISLGAPVGKKVEKIFDVPPWVMGGSLEIKRAFLSALWGAEGSKPRPAKNGKVPGSLVLAMCKRKGVNGQEFFRQLQILMCEFGVSTKIATASVGENTIYRLYVTGESNALEFLKIGYLFAEEKSHLAWSWFNYLQAKKFQARNRRTTVRKCLERGLSYRQVGESLGWSKGKVWRIANTNCGRASQDFSTFNEWKSDRLEGNRLRLKVVSKRKTKSERVYNIRVSSPDSSYLLANGINNFNSFETMGGRVYYPFDRHEHVGDHKFNKDLPMWVGQDFNRDPMSGVVLQPQKNGDIWAVGEIVLPNSSTVEAVQELERRYWRSKSVTAIFPDPAGAYKQHARGETDLDIFRESGYRRIYHRRKHPPVADRVNCVNRMLRSADGSIKLRIDRSCQHLIDSLEQTIYKEGMRDVDKTMGTEHSADALGYAMEFKFPLRKIIVAGLSL